MIQLSTWAGRHVAAVALTVAYTIVGPTPGLVAAMERVYAVAVVENERVRRRVPTGPGAPAGPWRPRSRRPEPTRP